MAVRIVTDSAAAIPAEVARAHGVTVVPMRLTVDGDEALDGALPLEQLLATERVTTSGPTLGDFCTVIDGALAEGDDVLVLTIAATMSSTYSEAVVAARRSSGTVRVLDTATAAGGEALVVLAAAHAARAGASLDEVERVATDVVGRVRLVATVPTLDRLVRSGHVPSLAGWAGRRLGINPLFEFRAGGVQSLRPALSRGAALDRIAGLLERSRVGGARLHVVALHALAAEEAHQLLDRVTAGSEPATAFVGEFGPVMVVHTGAGLMGLAWWWEPEG
ncbi:MAG: DegV family protein [Acidimicrobiia bacterium]